MTDLMVKLDWFSFTFPIALLGDKDSEWTLRHIFEQFNAHTDGRLARFIGTTLWSFSPTAGFYDHAIVHPGLLIRISWRAGNPHALCEMGGQALDRTLALIPASELALCAKGRCTRIDIATDIQTTVTPAEFSQGGYSDRIKSSTLMESPTGDTAYIGSRKGERMARIYRFHPPHPRSELLRIEVELKGEAAKMCCEEMTRVSLNILGLMVNRQFDWKHPIWNPDKIMVSKIPARAYDNEGAETLKWIEDVVVPSLRRAHEKGLIDLNDKLRSWFKGLIE